MGMKRQPPADTADQDLRRENTLLRGLLQTLGRDAAYNQQVMTRFQDRELALLSAGDLVRLLERLTDGMRASFALDSVKLFLFDPFSVVHDLLAANTDARVVAADGNCNIDIVRCVSTHRQAGRTNRDAAAGSNCDRATGHCHTVTDGNPTASLGYAIADGDIHAQRHLHTGCNPHRHTERDAAPCHPHTNTHNRANRDRRSHAHSRSHRDTAAYCDTRRNRNARRFDLVLIMSVAHHHQLIRPRLRAPQLARPAQYLAHGRAGTGQLEHVEALAVRIEAHDRIAAKVGQPYFV